MKVKHARYQDYVIRDGRFIGDFEGMYQDHEDPWEQGAKEQASTVKAAALHLCKTHGLRRICEIGCGHGHFTDMLHAAGFDVLGVDIAPTAVKKAAALYPHCRFAAGDILDFNLYKEFQPDCIILSEITWYVLDKLDAFLEFYRSFKTDAGVSPRLLHILTTYPEGVQKYGTDKFTDLEGILRYFNLDYDAYGVTADKAHQGTARTYFLGKAL